MSRLQHQRSRTTIINKSNESMIPLVRISSKANRTISRLGVHRSDSFLEDSDEEDEEAPFIAPALLGRTNKYQTQKPTLRRSCIQRLKYRCNIKEGNVAIFLVLAILFLLFLIIIGGLLMRPFFTFGLLMASGASLGFVLTESSSYGAWHHNREAENRFWIIVAIILSTTIIFAPDSPLSALGSTFPVLGILCVLLSAGWVHYYDRKLEREELGRAPHLRRVSSFILTDSESTKQKLQVVQDCLAALDYRFVAAKTINQKQIQEAELDILNLLKSCAKEELNYIITNVNLALLFYKIKDKDMLTWSKTEVQNRTRVLELLARERLGDLSVSARVVVLDALMNMRLKAHHLAEEWVRDIILGTHGRMLTRMKNACDLKGRVHNFHKLIFRDITSLTIRTQILDHLKVEAEVVKNDGLLPKERRKILSDVDDTLFSSGGRFPAGCDTSLPHHVLYPGVCTFYKELDLGSTSSTGEWEEGRQGGLAFLSARPGNIYKDKSEKKSYKLFEELRLMKNVGLHCVPTLLAGSLESGFHMFRGSFEPMSLKKFNNFLEYATLYPEFKFTFIGDNGQGDARAGELIKAALPDQVEAIFIHEVQPIHKTPGYINYDSLKHYDELGIYFFHTYIGAALQALKLNLIHPNGLRRIIQDSCTYLEELKTSPKVNLPVHVYDARRIELNRDIEAANTYLTEVLHLSPPCPMIPADCIFHVGSMVETSWGIGIVERFNHISGIYQIRLTDWVLTHSSVRVYIHGSEIVWHVKGQVGDAVSTKFGTGILTEIREQNGIHVIQLMEWGQTAPNNSTRVKGTKPSSQPHRPYQSNCPIAYLQPDDFTVILAAVGEQVQTMFGVGTVIQYRPPCNNPTHQHNRSNTTAAANNSSSSSSSTQVTPASSHIHNVASETTGSSITTVVPAAPFAAPPSPSSPHCPLTHISIYVVRLTWSDGGGAIAYLNARSIRKRREPAQRRCVIQ